VAAEPLLPGPLDAIIPVYFAQRLAGDTGVTTTATAAIPANRAI